METSSARPAFTSALYYEDPFAALDWLERAFGFEKAMVITDSDGNLAHSEMRHDDGLVMIGGTGWTDYVASPSGVSAKNTQSVHVHLKTPIDAHYARAKAAGAEIVRELADQFYGDRTYAARDPEGHVWTFGQTVAAVSREEAEQASGLTIDGWI